MSVVFCSFAQVRSFTYTGSPDTEASILVSLA